MGSSCGGCNYHTFPYESIPPILVEEKRENQLFENKEDVWKTISGYFGIAAILNLSTLWEWYVPALL